MKAKYQNAFFLFGAVLLASMVSQLDFREVWNGLQRAGYWFLAVLLLWAVLYVMNTASWYLIIRSQERGGRRQELGDRREELGDRREETGERSEGDRRGETLGERVPFGWLYMVTVSGFALNYATPGGLMGGEPYRIMALSPRIGTERASSSVILYAMTHIFSHFWFWAIGAVLYLLTRPLSVFMGVFLTAVGAFCALGIWFFMRGYRQGLAAKTIGLLRHLPLVKRWAVPFVERNKARLDTIDAQIAALHKQNRRTFVLAVLSELVCRLCSAMEIGFVLLVLQPQIDYIQCILILAFTSLLANLLFFLPLQLGGREAGFYLSSTGLGLSSSTGIFVALIVRLRELIWTAIGLLLIKLTKTSNTQPQPCT